MSTVRRLSYITVTAAGTALLVAGCSSSSTAPAVSPTTEAPATGAASGSMPAAPSGAKELNSSSTGGVEYARYEISGTTPQQVIDDYNTTAAAAGYAVTDTGGGGGGWGGWGGANAGLEGTMTGSYLNVQAGGQTSGPTYFEVCVGADQSAVDQCDQNSQNDQQNQKQNQNQDSNSSRS